MVFSGITNQRETAVAWDRKTGKPLCNAIVWTDNRNKGLVAHFTHKLRTEGLAGTKGDEAIATLRKM